MVKQTYFTIQCKNWRDYFGKPQCEIKHYPSLGAGSFSPGQDIAHSRAHNLTIVTVTHQEIVGMLLGLLSKDGSICSSGYLQGLAAPWCETDCEALPERSSSTCTQGDV